MLHNVQNSKFVPYMEVFSIDSWDQNRQEEQVRLLKQLIALSGEFVSQGQFSQTRCLGWFLVF